MPRVHCVALDAHAHCNSSPSLLHLRTSSSNALSAEVSLSASIKMIWRWQCRPCDDKDVAVHKSLSVTLITRWGQQGIHQVFSLNKLEVIHVSGTGAIELHSSKMADSAECTDTMLGF